MVAPTTRSPALFSTGIGSPRGNDPSKPDPPGTTRASARVLSPRATSKPIAHTQGFQGDIFLLAAGCDAVRGLGSQSQELADRRAGAPSRGKLEPFAPEHQRHDRRRHL